MGVIVTAYASRRNYQRVIHAGRAERYKVFMAAVTGDRRRGNVTRGVHTQRTSARHVATDAGSTTDPAVVKPGTTPFGEAGCGR